MSSQVPGSPLDGRGAGWAVTVTILQYVMLTFCVCLTLILRPANEARFIDLILSGLAAAWMLWMSTLHPAWRDRPRVMAVFVAGLLAIGGVLVFRDTWFGFFTAVIYLYVLLLSWPLRLLGAAATGVLAAVSQAYGVPRTTALGVMIFVVVLAVNVAGACLFTWLLWVNQQRQAQRDHALGELSEANRRLEATLAENAGLHQQLLTQAREAGVLDERQRMAREIHDTLAQGLTGIVTQLQAAEHASDDPAAWRRHFAAATRLARDSLSEARRSVHALRPGPLETGRLSDAVASIAERWSALHGITVQVATTGTARPMRPEAEFALLRTAQEALANVARHAQATRVGVTLSYMEHEVALDVRDDGRGFAPPGGTGTGPGGFGLVAMRQRIEGLSGTLQVESEPGAGTGISACIPAATAEARP